jgi:DNA-binding MarR family transcriptional regulator
MRFFSQTYTLLHRRRGANALSVTPEGRALLLHLAWSGPMTVGELTKHVERAQSVVSESLGVLEAHGLLERVRDPRDQRRSLVWLTERARVWLAEEQEPLDRPRLEGVFSAMSAEATTVLLQSFGEFLERAEAHRRDGTELTKTEIDEVNSVQTQK